MVKEDEYYFKLAEQYEEEEKLLREREKQYNISKVLVEHEKEKEELELMHLDLSHDKNEDVQEFVHRNSKEARNIDNHIRTLVKENNGKLSKENASKVLKDVYSYKGLHYAAKTVSEYVKSKDYQKIAKSQLKKYNYLKKINEKQLKLELKDVSRCEKKLGDYDLRIANYNAKIEKAQPKLSKIERKYNKKIEKCHISEHGYPKKGTSLCREERFLEKIRYKNNLVKKITFYKSRRKRFEKKMDRERDNLKFLKNSKLNAMDRIRIPLEREIIEIEDDKANLHQALLRVSQTRDKIADIEALKEEVVVSDKKTKDFVKYMEEMSVYYSKTTDELLSDLKNSNEKSVLKSAVLMECMALSKPVEINVNGTKISVERNSLSYQFKVNEEEVPLVNLEDVLIKKNIVNEFKEKVVNEFKKTDKTFTVEKQLEYDR